MEAQDMARRAEVARRLKAARWLAGGVEEDGKAKVTALSPQDLAKRSPLPENNITASLIGSIERMERHTPPMELEALAAALRLPADYFTGEEIAAPGLSPEQIRQAAELLAPQLLEAARALGRASGSTRPALVGRGHATEAPGGGDG